MKGWLLGQRKVSFGKEMWELKEKSFPACLGLLNMQYKGNVITLTL